MIESIEIKNIATFDDTGIQINELKKVNFIYGVNGSGKTTITKFLYNQDNPNFANSSLKWVNRLAINTLVYNKDFRERNFGKGSFDGVFTLGQATKEQTEEIEKKRIELRELKDRKIQKKSTLDKQIENKKELENQFKEEVWVSIYKKHENTFKEAFKGVMQKELFKNRILEEYENNTTELKTLDYLLQKAATIFGKAPQTMNLLPEIEFSRLLEIEDDKIWQKKIVGKSDVDIAKLIQKLNLNDWVNEGRNYIQENDQTCPFCQQATINEDFKNKLDNYFDKEFITDTGLVKSNSEEYIRLFQNLVNELSQIETNEKVNQTSKLKMESFSAFLKTFESQFISNKEILNNKIKEPSRSFELIKVKEQLENIQQLITTTNEQIKKHNQIVLNYSTERSKLVHVIWKYITDESKARIESFIKHDSGLQKGILAISKIVEKLKLDYNALDLEIKKLAKNITSIQPSVDEINRILKSFGFLNFEIIPSKTGVNQYQILREDGTLAESTLSEGEITFITFLYFLQLAKGGTTEENITEERVLIVDDPISSLDSNVLFIVSTLLKEIIKAIKKDEGNIKQLILLTHNVYFHKEVSFIDGRTKESGDTFFWILRRNDNVSTIECFELKNPIQNSYELLWQELKIRDNTSIITTQNVMRRIIENYFKILGKYGDDELINKFENRQEQEICRSLICWINDGSHGIPDDLFIEHQQNMIEIYHKVFKSIFKETGHIEHYKMMMN
jgi:wobble nucleotide-excising tRNase